MDTKKPIIKPKISVELDITAFRGRPERISQLLGIVPDEAWTKGSVMPDRPGYTGPKPRFWKYSCWTIRASLKEYSYELEDYVKDIIQRITPVRARIKAIQPAKLFLRGHIEIYDLRASTPAIGLGVNEMRFLSEIGAEVDLDLALVIDPDNLDEYAEWAKS